MKISMKKVALGLSAGALALGGFAYAQGGPGGPGRHGPMMDADGDGVVTRAEAQASAAAMFTRMDVNKDGKIDAADREARRTQRKEEMFARLDTDKNGSISKAEFMAAKGPGDGRRGGPGMDGPPPEGMARGDGPAMGPDGKPGPRGDKERGGRHHGAMHGKGHGPRGGGMMTMADTNNDGAISQAEFTAAAMKHFDMMDANKDGKVTAEERKAAHEKMKAEWKSKKGERKPAPTGSAN